jgi:uncharacterized protein (TIGR03083 family)
MASDLWTDSGFLSAYVAVQVRVAALVSASRNDQAVPACPDWRVRDVVAHLAGLCEDWVNRRLNGCASDAWTASQVDRFAHSSCDEIVEAWATAIDSFSHLDLTLGGIPAAQAAFGDAVIHEADIRGAYGAQRVPEDAVLLSFEIALDRWASEVLGPAELLPLHIKTPEGDGWRLGPENGDAGLLEIPRYELFRALAGRRGAEQVLEYHWSAQADRYVQAGLPYPFRWAPSPLSD